MGGPQDILDLHLNSQLFKHFTVEGIFKTFSLIHPPSDTFPGTGCVILKLGAAQK